MRTEKEIKEANAIGLVDRERGVYGGFMDRILNMAYILGTDGISIQDAPVVSGWRFGSIPASGISHNYRDDCCERGLSLAAIGDSEEFVPSCIFMCDRKKVKATGVLLPFTGSDGEPLILLVDNEDEVVTPSVSNQNVEITEEVVAKKPRSSRRYVCSSCGAAHSIKRVNAMLQAGFGLQHFGCRECGEHAIIDTKADF